ncbi:MAG: hypothetical protein EON48_00135 [Acetobacteraceae bacterium]|nr:MAG: hypothetical protein EON48_00135 [Acetobacteraceae bacterium]
MFKFMLIAIVIAVAAVALTSKKSDKQVMAEAAMQIRKSCQVKGASTNAISANQLQAFCQCSGDKMVAALGIDGVRRLKSADAPSTSDHDKMKAIGPACMAEVVSRQ